MAGWAGGDGGHGGWRPTRPGMTCLVVRFLSFFYPILVSSPAAFCPVALLARWLGIELHISNEP